MFDNIASTLKTLSTIILVVAILISIVAAIAIVSISDGLPFVAAAICVLIGGILTACVGACSLYGFGELIEKATEIAKNTQPASTDSNTTIPHASKPATPLNNNASSNTTQPTLDPAKNRYDNAYYTDNSFETLANASNQNISACIIHPNTKTINVKAFEYCSKLNDITIPEGVTTIGNYAFYACKELKSITIPHSVTSIGFGVFRWCDNLTRINYVGTPQDFANLGSSWAEGLPDQVQIVFEQQ